MSARELRTCAVVGVGLIGGSLGMALRATGRRVLGLDVQPGVLVEAQARGAIDEGVQGPEGLASVDLAIVAVPPTRVAGAVRSIASHLRPGAAVVDVASVKAPLVAEIEAAPIPGIRFVGSHPMFGTEGQGVSAARAELVRGAAWIFTPTARTDGGALESLESLARELGMRPLRRTPQDHDEELAALSHLPYLISVALTRTAPNFEVAGPAFRDMSRVAGSPTALWQDILSLNGAAVSKAVDRLCAELQRLTHLERQNLQSSLDEARARRLAWAPPH